MECAGGQLLSSESHPDPRSSLLRAVAGADAASRGPCGQLDHAPGPCLGASIHSLMPLVSQQTAPVQPSHHIPWWGPHCSPGNRKQDALLESLLRLSLALLWENYPGC